MSSRVTMQDIADALGLSRNTVSKAINHTGIIADSTRELILRKAVEMGYRQFSDAGSAGLSIPGEAEGRQGPEARLLSPSAPALSDKKEIALLTASMPGNSHFAVTTLDRMQQIFSSLGDSMTIYQLLPQQIEDLQLPGSLYTDKIAGIFCIELFNYEYCRMLSTLGIPFLLIDSPVCFDREPLSADILLMENQAGILTFLKKMSEAGKTTVGFIGNMMHCRSFFERGSACITGAELYGFSPVRPRSILHFPPGKSPARAADYTEELYQLMQKMPSLPEIFVCANDFLAINAISSLRRMGKRCPEDILIFGFDDSPESRFHSPMLSTVHIHTQAIGRAAAEMLLRRIKDPDREYRTSYIRTDLLLRESTGPGGG